MNEQNEPFCEKASAKTETFTKYHIQQRVKYPYWTQKELEIIRDLYPTAEQKILYEAHG